MTEPDFLVLEREEPSRDRRYQNIGLELGVDDPRGSFERFGEPTAVVDGRDQERRLGDAGKLGASAREHSLEPF
jgi:hypothetical protein